MKRVLLIRGSAREGSYTNAIADRALAAQEGIEVTAFSPYEAVFAPCDGCNFCETAGRCRHDDLTALAREFETCDVVLIASPVYNGGFPAPVKALLDRLQVYYTGFYANGKRPLIAKHRRVVLLAAAGRDGNRALRVMADQLRNACSVTNAEPVGAALCPQTDGVPAPETTCETLCELLKRSLTDEEANR